MARRDDERDGDALDGRPDAAGDGERGDDAIDIERDAVAREPGTLGDGSTGAEGEGDDEDGEMGLMAEPHSADELADAALGRDLRGKRGVTRDDEGHAEEFLDKP